jgi:hypothetical protein
LGFFRNRRKGSAVKNLAGALYAERVGCTLSVPWEAKMEIPVYFLQTLPMNKNIFSMGLILAELFRLNLSKASTLLNKQGGAM